MGDRNGAAKIIGRKRGHQHHPRQSGIRLSNVPAIEVIAALRGETLPHDDDNEYIEDVNTNIGQVIDSNQNVIVPISNFDSTELMINDNVAISETADNNTQETTTKESTATSAFLLCDDDKLISDAIDNKAELESIVISPSSSNKKKSRTKPSHNVSNNSGSNTKIVNQSNTNNNNNGAADHREPIKRKKKSHTNKNPHTQQLSAIILIGEERPPLEGATSEDMMEMEENDPEAAEWSKLRCTSERTEVVAEREYRRQNRRCADYPGLAFGRSIFSSDTMMKFNIIRNELHNIMKTQLKRVRFFLEEKDNGILVTNFFTFTAHFFLIYIFFFFYFL